MIVYCDAKECVCCRDGICKKRRLRIYDGSCGSYKTERTKAMIFTSVKCDRCGKIENRYKPEFRVEITRDSHDYPTYYLCESCGNMLIKLLIYGGGFDDAQAENAGQATGDL